MSTARVPQGAAGHITTLPAPGRPVRPHVSTGTLRDAIAWLMRLRQLQADGLSFDDALTQANEEEES